MPPTTAPPTTAAKAPLFSLAKTQVGDVMVDAKGLTLYMFDPDKNKPGGSVCNGGCAAVWPPVIVSGDADLVAPAGFGGKLSTVKRDDGKLQAAVNGLPLYGWVFDKIPADLNGQANNEVWWALDKNGNPVRNAPSLRWRTNTIAGVEKNTPVLVDSKGMTLYMFERDTAHPESYCYDDCAKAWPPVLVNDSSALSVFQGTNVDKTKLGVVRRAETAQFQVTYNGWPLYTWARDTKPGETTGQKVGNVWWVMGVDGPVRS